MKVYYFEKDIRNVTEMYYGVILSALKRKNIETIPYKSASLKEIRSIDRNSYILITSLNTFIKLWVFGFRNFIYWFQGVTPEESRMQNGSNARYYFWSFCERLALKTVKYKIGVSTYLFKHFEKKYGLNIPLEDIFIMPCFNSDFHQESFFKNGKYSKNIFCFAGGMQPWQGFEDIVSIFKKLECLYQNVFLKVYSKELEEAKEILSKYEINNYSVECVPADDMERVLSDCKFGFIIREDDVINNVATPTKLATYVGNGIIPIYTPTIYSFADLSKRYKYLCCTSKEDIIRSIEPYLQKEIDPNDVCEEYKRLFLDYYNKEAYVQKMMQFLDVES